MSTPADNRDKDLVSQQILAPGHNCWDLQNATRASVIIDTADYFAAFAEACSNAQRQILILGWDFDRLERLYRDDKPRDHPDQLGAFLVSLVKHNKDLRIYLLSWDFNMIYAAERELLPALRLRLQAPPRFHFRLDGAHPKGASQHQKVVVIDDRVAFSGGIDLSRWRWDTCAHRPDDPRRIDPNGKPYPPFHDMMMLVEGSAAARLGQLARERWRRARGWKIKPPITTAASPWPASIEPQLHNTPIAISRTEPAYDGRAAVNEVKQLYLDAISKARRFIYIENQYFTARCLGKAIIDRLAEPDGPDVVLILPKQTGAWLEQVTMDVLRGRVVQRIQQADIHGRLRVYYPHLPGLGKQCISVHAKFLIVDDRFARVGSANTSSRSMGLDSECDLAIEAQEPQDATQQFIKSLRQRLLAEHLGRTPEQVAAAESEQTGLIATIESLRDDQRSLRPLDCKLPTDVDDMVPDSDLIDPPEPLSPDYFVAQYVPQRGRSNSRNRLLLFAVFIIALLGLAAAWRWTPLQELLSPQRLSQVAASISSPELRALAAITGFFLASLLMVPLTLLAVISGIAFDGWQGFAYVLAGALCSAALGFIGGRLMGGGIIKRLRGSPLKQLSKRLAQRGTFAVAVLRILPIAPFAIFNLLAGASHLGFRQFFFGSLMGLAPGLGAITLFSASLWEAIQTPSIGAIGIAAALGIGLAGLAWMAKRWLRSG